MKRDCTQLCYTGTMALSPSLSLAKASFFGVPSSEELLRSQSSQHPLLPVSSESVEYRQRNHTSFLSQ